MSEGMAKSHLRLFGTSHESTRRKPVGSREAAESAAIEAAAAGSRNPGLISDKSRLSRAEKFAVACAKNWPSFRLRVQILVSSDFQRCAKRHTAVGYRATTLNQKLSARYRVATVSCAENFFCETQFSADQKTARRKAKIAVMLQLLRAASVPYETVNFVQEYL